MIYLCYRCRFSIATWATCYINYIPRVHSSSACAMGFAVGWEKSPRNGVLNNARDDTLVIDVKINRIAWGPILGSMSWLVVAGVSRVSIGTWYVISVIRNRAIEHWHMFQKETLPQRCANLRFVCCHGCKRISAVLWSSQVVCMFWTCLHTTNQLKAERCKKKHRADELFLQMLRILWRHRSWGVELAGSSAWLQAFIR